MPASGTTRLSERSLEILRAASRLQVERKLVEVVQFWPVDNRSERAETFG
jgi:hypothetical protein